MQMLHGMVSVAVTEEWNGKTSTQKTRGRASWCSRWLVMLSAHQARSFPRLSCASDRQQT